MHSTKASVVMLVFLLPLGSEAQREVRPRVGAPPTGFIDVAMTWYFSEKYDQGEAVDEGSCSTRLDLQAKGSVRAEHRYQRTVTRRSWLDEARQNETVHQTVYLNALRLPPPGIDPIASATTYFYPGNPRLVIHRDDSASLTLQRQSNPISTVTQEVITRREGGKESDPQEGRWRLFHAACDPIEALYIALDAKYTKKLGSLPALKGDVTDLLVRGGGLLDHYLVRRRVDKSRRSTGRAGFPIGATVSATWELTP